MQHIFNDAQSLIEAAVASFYVCQRKKESNGNVDMKYI